jgi:hypothetical protein
MSTDYEKATPVPEQLRKFLSLGADVKLPRTEVAKQIYSYVREKDLRDKDDRRIIHPDAAIQKLFNLKKDETINFKSFKKYISLHYPDGILDECWSEESEDQIKVSTEQELLAQIEALRKKAKYIEEQNKDTEFNNQRNFLISTVRNFLGIDVSDTEVLAVLYKSSHTLNHNPSGEIGYYLKKEDENMLFERKVSNRYARQHEIRCEDSDMIIRNFLEKIKPRIDRSEFIHQQQKKFCEHQLEQQSRVRKAGNYNINLTQYVPEKYVPLFC